MERILITLALSLFALSAPAQTVESSLLLSIKAEAEQTSINEYKATVTKCEYEIDFCIRVLITQENDSFSWHDLSMPSPP